MDDWNVGTTLAVQFAVGFTASLAAVVVVKYSGAIGHRALRFGERHREELNSLAVSIGLGAFFIAIILFSVLDDRPPMQIQVTCSNTCSEAFSEAVEDCRQGPQMFLLRGKEKLKAIWETREKRRDPALFLGKCLAEREVPAHEITLTRHCETADSVMCLSYFGMSAR